MFELPVFRVDADFLSEFRVRLAKGVSIDFDPDGPAVRNSANGGKVTVGSGLGRVLELFDNGTDLQKAFEAQRIWGSQMFTEFITFLYRNEYLELKRLPVAARGRPVTVPETAHV
jgi:hypothetical protein